MKLEKIDEVVKNCSDLLKGVEIGSKGGNKTNRFVARPYLLNTWRIFHNTYKEDGNAYNLFPKEINGKRHLAFQLTAMYSLKNPINCGELPLNELEELFSKESVDLMAGTPQYLEKVLGLPSELFKNLKVVVGGAYTPNKKLVQRIRELGAKPYWTYGSTDFMDAFTTLNDFEDGYFVHQGRFEKSGKELIYNNSRFKEAIRTGDIGEIIEKNGKQFIKTYSIKKMVTRS